MRNRILPQTLDAKFESSLLKSPLLYRGNNGADIFLHDTYRDFFLAKEFHRKVRCGELSLLEFYDKFFELLGGFDKWKNLSEFILEMIEDNFTPSLAKAVRDDHDLRKISTIEQFLPNGSGSKTFIQINDYYCTYKAQKVIMEMENVLIERYGIKLILREGISGKLDVSPFAEFSDKKIKAEVCDYFMNKGKINADEALTITTDLDFISWGVEDPEFFKKCHESKASGEGYDVIGKVESNVRRIFVGLAIHDMPDAIFVYGSSFNDWFTRNILVNKYSYIRLNPIFEGGRRDEETYQKILRGEKTQFEQFLEGLDKQ